MQIGTICQGLFAHTSPSRIFVDSSKTCEKIGMLKKAFPTAFRYAPAIYYPVWGVRWLLGEAVAKYLPESFDFWFWGYLIGAYLIGVLVRDFSSSLWERWKNRGIKFKVHLYNEASGGHFREQQYSDGEKITVLPFHVRNTGQGTIQNIEITLKYLRIRSPGTKLNDVSGYDFHFQDGTNNLNGKKGKTAILAFRRENGKVYLGDPMDERPIEIIPNSVCSGILEIHGTGSKAKIVTIVIEAEQYEGPVLSIRSHTFDEDERDLG